jgi:DNA-binding transcriptional regulator YiaG
VTPTELRSAIATLGLSAEGFARMIGVAGRTVRLWQHGDRDIPGPLVALVDLLLHCKPARTRFLRRRNPAA